MLSITPNQEDLVQLLSLKYPLLLNESFMSFENELHGIVMHVVRLTYDYILGKI